MSVVREDRESETIRNVCDGEDGKDRDSLWALSSTVKIDAELR